MQDCTTRVIGEYPQIRPTLFAFTYRVGAHPAELIELSVWRITNSTRPCFSRLPSRFFTWSSVLRLARASVFSSSCGDRPRDSRRATSARSWCLSYISDTIEGSVHIEQCSSLSPKADTDRVASLFALISVVYLRWHCGLCTRDMLLRGIAFAEARRNSARLVFKGRERTQSTGCEKDVADLSQDESRHTRKPIMVCRAADFPITFVSCKKVRLSSEAGERDK